VLINVLIQGHGEKVTVHKASCTVRWTELMSSITQTIVLWCRRRRRLKLMQNMSTVRDDFHKERRVGLFKPVPSANVQSSNVQTCNFSAADFSSCDAARRHHISSL